MTMMKLGLHTAILEGYSFEQVVDYAAETGFESLEVCCWPQEPATRRYAGVTHIDVDGLTEEKAEAYLAYAKRRGIKIAALAYFPNPMSDEPEVAEKSRKHLYKVIDAAKLMDVRLRNGGYALRLKTARCILRETNGRAATIWQRRRRSGVGCLQWGQTSDFVLIRLIWFCWG